ncbi:hypothetical protein E3N88_27156 [Mikania micrantha]|uniref:Phloem protein 2-like protein n=1 Tax=Mikania micrantha TaxID=192012 RepID=A0A5N6MYQ8_9ASTR|nr:hypothetical protein E3N88_27156 [Mikania micrantha]
MLLNAAVPLNDSSESEMKMLLLKGILINSGKTWLSRNMNGYNCELISIAKCLTPSASESQHFISSPEYTSRFAVGCYEPLGGNFITCIETQFLSPQTMYTVNLVFKRKNSKDQYIGLEYKLVEEEHSSYLFVSDERDDGWLTLELYQFSSHQQKIKLEIVFYSKYCPDLLVESIEFRPLEKVEDEVLRVEDVDMKPESDTEENWKQKLPIDYEEIVRWHSVQWRTMKELYYILCEGFLINDGKEWFSIAKDGKKCLMLPAKAILKEKEWEWKLKPETRFGQVADCVSKRFGITCKISAKMLSPQTKYTSYLVYSGQPHEKNDINPPLQVVNIYSEEKCNIFLSAPKTPVINWNEEEKTFNPSSRTKIKGLPKLRSDGWMEVQVHDFQTPESDYSIYLRFSSYDMKSLKGITVLGLEFRPI